MADAAKGMLSWPTASWTVLKKLVRAWYTAENSGGEWTQRTVAKLADVQPSRVSANKAFLQAMGIVQSEGIGLTDAGRNLGLGLSNENPRVTQQALQKVVRENSVLWHLLNIIRSRGVIDTEDFEAEILLLTKQGSDTPGFSIGVGVLEDILLESGFATKSDNAFRPVRGEFKDEPPVEEQREEKEQNNKQPVLPKPGLRQIPIPVSASTIWYIEVSENAKTEEIEKFIEMQKLIFGVQPK
jgi:hypothetical protein